MYHYVIKLRKRTICSVLATESVIKKSAARDVGSYRFINIDLPNNVSVENSHTKKQENIFLTYSEKNIS